MKNFKKNLLKILTFALVFCTLFTLFACGKCSHTDGDNDGKCDKCGETVERKPREVLLIDENGAPTFQIVTGDEIDADTTRTLKNFVRDLRKIGIEVDLVKDIAENVKDCEILIGDVKTRGEKYIYDKHTLGKEGYVIKIVDSKIIINAGSPETLFSTVKNFISDVIGLSSDVTKLYSVSMREESEAEVIQGGYTVTSLSVNGVNIKGYTIAADTSDGKIKAAAENLQNAIYEKVGYWFEIVPPAEADKSIIIKQIPKKSGDGSFKITANSDNQLVIECAYLNKLCDSVSEFVKTLSSKSGDVNFEGTVMSLDVSVVYYEDFGAKGDGKTNDFEAMKATHDFANECGQTVKSKNPTKAKYYISDTRILGKTEAITVKTNVDFGGAEIIIDDSELECNSVGMHTEHVFNIASDYEMTKITDKALLQKIVAAGLNPQTKKIDLGLGYPALIIPVNSSHKVYRRKGYGGWAGYDMSEVIVIDKDGNVDMTTRAAFDYNALDYIEVYRTDVEPITFENAKITTIVSKYDTVYITEDGKKATRDSNYFKRGIEILRSNTTLKNINHFVEGEFSIDEQIAGKVGVAYNGFFFINTSNKVTLDSCILTAHRAFNKIFIGSFAGTQGTYDMQIYLSNKTVFKNCTQSNFWVDDDAHAVERGTPGAKPSMAASTKYGYNTARMHWGIGGSNDAKNVEYIGCILSRFDAHRGMLNGFIKDSAVSCISLTGGGDLVVENVEWYPETSASYANGLILLRDDYGSTWNGTVTMKNIKAYPAPDKTGDGHFSRMWIVPHTYTNWYFGYVSHFPSISIENLEIYDRTTITAQNPTGDKIPTDKIELYYTTGSYVAEPDMHLAQTKNSNPYFADVDADGDGKVDGTNISYVGEPNRSGICDSSTNKNLNPIVPPAYFKIKNFGGYTIVFQNENTTFLDSTYIEIDGVVKNSPD